MLNKVQSQNIERNILIVHKGIKHEQIESKKPKNLLLDLTGRQFWIGTAKESSLRAFTDDQPLSANQANTTKDFQVASYLNDNQHYIKNRNNNELNLEDTSSQEEFTVKDIAVSNQDIPDPNVHHALFNKNLRNMNNKPTQILKQHVSKEYDLQQPVTKIDKEVGPELDNNMSCSSSQIYLNNTITAGGGDLSQDEPSTNLYHPSMLYHNNDYSKSKSTASSPHYLVNKNQFSIRSPRLPIPSNTNRIFPNGIGGKENPKLLLNINTNNNQQVFNRYFHFSHYL